MKKELLHRGNYVNFKFNFFCCKYVSTKYLSKFQTLKVSNFFQFLI